MVLADVLKKHSDKFKDLEISFIQQECFAYLNEAERSLIRQVDDLKKRSYFVTFLSNKEHAVIDAFVSKLENDYYWLYELFLEVIDFGCVPPFPPHNVTRTELVSKVRGKLKTLKSHHILVLHGMMGSGKTCLAAEAVRNREILAYFNKKVFWISVGAEKPVYELLNELNEMLPERVPASDDEVMLAKQLGEKFKDEKLSRALIVLDDVSDVRVIKAFSFNVNLLVTTKINDIADNLHRRTPWKIKVDEKFTQEEAFKVWSQCLKRPPPQRKAQELYEACKGFPMLIAKIGCKFADMQQGIDRDDGYWEHFLTIVKQKGFNFTNTPLIIDDLPKDMKSKYEFFSLIFEDVNITSEALGTIWCTPTKYAADELAAEFVSKHLLVRKFDEALKCFVYGIHDVYLTDLRKKQTSEDKTNLHRQLISNYERTCDGDFSKLVNDNYIFRYIGFHLKNAGYVDMFPKLYRNLEFIEAKLRAVGPSDLLLDFTKYKNEIQDENSTYEWLVKRIGQNVYENKDIDIVQFIFQEIPLRHFLYKEAMKLAEKRKETKYIKFLNESGKRRSISSQEVLVIEDVTTISATNHSNYVLVGHKNGKITVWDILGKECIEEFTDQQGAAITCIRLREGSEEWVSSSNAGSVAVRTFGLDNVVTLKAEHRVLWVTFSQKGDCIAVIYAERNKCTTEIWSKSGENLMNKGQEMVEEVWNNDKEFTAQCVFMREDSTLITATGSSVLVYRLINGEKLCVDLVKRIKTEEHIVSLCLYPDSPNEFGVLTQVSLMVWNTENILTQDGSPTSNRFKITSSDNFDETFTCCAVMGDVYVGTSTASVNVYNWKTGRYLNQLSKNLTPIAMSAGDKKQKTVWVLGSANSIWRWEVGEADTRTSCSPFFSWAWLPGTKLPLIASESSGRECLNIIKENMLLKTLELPRNPLFHLCEDGECIAYLDSFLAVRLEYISDGSIHHITNLRKATNQFLRVFKTTVGHMVVATAKNGQNLPLKVAINSGPGSPFNLFDCDYGSSSTIVEVFFISQKIFVVLKNKQIMVWDTKGKLLNELQIPDYNSVIRACSHKKGLIALLFENSVMIVNDTLTTIFHKQLNYCTAVSFSVDGLKLIVAYSNSIFEVMIGESDGRSKDLKTGGDEVVSVAKSKTGDVCALTCERVYILTNGGSLVRARIMGGRNVAVSKDSSLFFTVDSAGLLHVFSLFNQESCSNHLTN